MSLRSRRSQGAAAGGGFASAPSVPISEIRTRKWTKQAKTVGHLLLSKWVPDQEAPTALLQKGSFKKTKGRKRAAVEVGRMTRSVRQHLDAPLELLNEYPTLRKPVPAVPVAPVAAAPAVVAESVQPTTVMTTEAPLAPAAAPVAEAAMAASIAPLAAESTPIPAMSMLASNSMDMTSSDHMLAPPSNMYSSNEQLERDLDDLPFLDVEEMPMSVISEEQAQHSLNAQQPAPVADGSFTGMTAIQSEEQKNDDEDEADGDSDSGSSGDEAGSTKSWSPLPSPSPNSSPAPSASPSP